MTSIYLWKQCFELFEIETLNPEVGDLPDDHRRSRGAPRMLAAALCGVTFWFQQPVSSQSVRNDMVASLLFRSIKIVQQMLRCKGDEGRC